MMHVFYSDLTLCNICEYKQSAFVSINSSV